MIHQLHAIVICISIGTALHHITIISAFSYLSKKQKTLDVIHPFDREKYRLRESGEQQRTSFLGFRTWLTKYIGGSLEEHDFIYFFIATDLRFISAARSLHYIADVYSSKGGKSMFLGPATLVKRKVGIEVSEEMARKIMECEEGSKFSGVYVLFSRFYTMSCKWDEVGLVWKMMADKGVAKEPGCSTIEQMVWLMSSLQGVELQLKMFKLLAFMGEALYVRPLLVSGWKIFLKIRFELFIKLFISSVMIFNG